MSTITPMTGGCHCGNLSIDLELSCPPEDCPVRACDCSFCRRHGARSVSDPRGRVSIRSRDASALVRYRFGLSTADFLLCARCGVYVAALWTGDAQSRATINLNTLDDRDLFTRLVEPVSYAGETAAERSRRRSERWTPATLSAGAPPAPPPPPPLPPP